MAKLDLSAIFIELNNIKKHSISSLNTSKSLDELLKCKNFILGKNNKLSKILQNIKDLSIENKEKVGKAANIIKKSINSLYTKRSIQIKKLNLTLLLNNGYDLDLPGIDSYSGSTHPLSKIKYKVLGIFKKMGFTIVYGPEIEYDFFNFEALNILKLHPARDMQDSFYIEKNIVLRTHTSPVQIRTMLSYNKPPIKIATAGRVYRKDQDLTHSPIFHQIEGLFIDRNLTFFDLKKVLYIFLSNIFNSDIDIRLRPSFFPFTTPSIEVDISCSNCRDTSKYYKCSVCRDTKWIEILGAGMVDRNVLEYGNIDPEKYSGYAFGIGIERIGMLIHQIPDIKLFYENDLRFLQQL